MRKVINYMCILLMLSSCHKSMKGVGYAKYIQDPEHGLRKIITVGEMEYTLQYRPNEFVVYQELHGVPDNAAIDKRMKQMGRMVWFNISFKRTDGSAEPLRNGVTDNTQYNTRLNYYLNEAGKKIKLLYGTSTLFPADYVFENNYNLTPQATMVVGFRLPASDAAPRQDMQLTYVDEVFNNGIVKATYSTDDIKNAPKLIY